MSSEVFIALEPLCKTQTWHFLVDAELRVVAAGQLLRQFFDGVVGRRLGELGVAVRSQLPLTEESIAGATGQSWLFEVRSTSKLLLRVQLVPTGGGGYLFVGAPDVIGELEARLEHEKTERERVEDELRLAHRLEAVGQLAAGVAHEINTPIQYIGDSVQFLSESFVELAPLDIGFNRAVRALRAAGDEATATELEDLREEVDADFLFSQVPRAFERALDGLKQVAGIVRAMKAFAHPGEATRSSADINEALANTLAVARNEYKYVADVETSFADLPRIPCYPAELNQVFLNLLVNAAHAVAESVDGTTRRGQIRVRTSIEDGCAVITVADNGVGIPDAVRDRIFDPFFTTKPVGKGTGQGLTIARSIVSKHQGRLEVRSKVGQGTTFRVHLPLEEGQTACLQ